MNVKVNLFPLDVVGSCPVESTAQLANSTCGISRSTDCVQTLFGNNLRHNLQVSNPPEVSPHHVDSSAHSLIAFAIMKL